MANDPVSYLVAHRGDQEKATENSLAAFKNAVTRGARYLECDIQFTRDLKAVVSHDIRVGGSIISQLESIELPSSLLRLESLFKWLDNCKGVTLFLEIKSPILRRKSATAVTALVYGMIPDSLRARVIPIAVSAKLIEALASCFTSRIGWVAEGTTKPVTPFDFIFLPEKRISEAASWHEKGVITAVYTIDNASHASQLYSNGIDLIETNYFSRLQQSVLKTI